MMVSSMCCLVVLAIRIGAAIVIFSHSYPKITSGGFLLHYIDIKEMLILFRKKCSTQHGFLCMDTAIEQIALQLNPCILPTAFCTCKIKKIKRPRHIFLEIKRFITVGRIPL